MMSNQFYGPSYDDTREMTQHHLCSGDICVGCDHGGELCVDYALRNSIFVRTTCCCPSPNSNARENIQTNTDGRSYTERRNDSYVLYRKKSVYSVLYSFCIFLCIVLSKCSAQSTVCDFKGSGLDLKGNGIQPAYLSCSSGRVDWHYPRAALRIVLQYPGEDRDFHGCIKVSPDIEGARLFVEGHRSLVPLYSKDDGQPKEKVRCFTSFRGLVALYLEAEPSSGFRDLKASFEYDLQALPKGAIYDPLEECRPCSSSEMVQLYCSADFAAKGFIISAEDNPRLQQTKVTLAASKVFQQTTPIFSKGPELKMASIGAKSNQGKLPDVEHFTDIVDNEIPEDYNLLGQLFMPLECGARAGVGEFMVLGTVRFGQPVLRCAPRIEEWKNLVESARDRAHCVLES